MIDIERLVAAGLRAGLHTVGVCRADPFSETARLLHERKEAGLHGGMQFTYRNPDRSTDPGRLLPGAVSLVVGALAYCSRAPTEREAGRPGAGGLPLAGGPDGGISPTPRTASAGEQPAAGPRARVAAYARADYYAALRGGLESVASILRDAGHSAVVSADENHLVDRAAAYRAGIGWRGKSASILMPGAGSMAVIGAVVTDAPIEYGEPEPMADGCGPCRRCLDGCPTGAITEPGVVDARRCLAWLLQAEGVFDVDFRIALGDRIYGCDECSEVCPPNRVRLRRERKRSRGGAGAPLSDAAWVQVLDLLAASDSELMDAYGRWYIPRRQPRYLRRNALVVLGNIGDPSQPRVRAAVERALADADPLIAAHAVWCARRLGLGVGPLVRRDDPMVSAELARDVPPRAGLAPREPDSDSAPARPCRSAEGAVRIGL